LLKYHFELQKLLIRSCRTNGEIDLFDKIIDNCIFCQCRLSDNEQCCLYGNYLYLCCYFLH